MTSTDRTSALFDVLTHHESYNEILALGDSPNLRTFGHPLQDNDVETSSSVPLLHLLIHRFVLTLPGLRDIDRGFWTKDIVDLVTALAESGLSESRDRGTVGLRKQVSTLLSSLIEEVSRGTLGGFKSDVGDHDSYDLSNSRDLGDAFDEFIRQSLYGNMIPKLVEKVSQTQNLADHDSLVQAAHKYAMIMVSSALHYMFIHAPQGQYILNLLKSVHDMIPYFLIRQTLRIGNVASMINTMVKIVLAKMSMSSVTSWFGASGSTSGMNLLQYIISTVLGWDISSLQKGCSAIEKDPGRLSKSQLDSLKAYAHKEASDQREIRHQSVTNQKPLTQSILTADSASNVENQDLDACERYLSANLAITDREKLITVLCRHQPDLLTGTVRSLVTAYEPIIRALHQAVDLSGSLADLQAFLSELITLSSQGRGEQNNARPTVEDYHSLLDKHVPKFHKFLHEACKNSAELRDWYQAYSIEALSQYKARKSKPDTKGAAGDFTNALEDAIAALSPADRNLIEKELDQHYQDITILRTTSSDRLQQVVKNLSEGRSNTQFGPGIYLAKWQRLMEQSTAGSRDTKEEPKTQGGTTSQNNVEVAPESKKQSLQPESVTSCPATIDRLIAQFRHELAQPSLLDAEV